MSLNKVQLIGNVTGDPELRYTAQGTAVCTFSVATNRSWNDSAGQRQEMAEFTRCVAWTKLAEICSQLIRKGRKVYVEGRLQTREWEGQDGGKRRTTEVVIEQMIALDSAGSGSSASAEAKHSVTDEDVAAEFAPSVSDASKSHKKKDKKPVQVADEGVDAEDIPF